MHANRDERREWRRQRKAFLLGAGLCCQGDGNPVVAGRTQCAQHLCRLRERVSRVLAAGFCRDGCGRMPRTGQQRCVRCSAKATYRSLRFYARKRGHSGIGVILDEFVEWRLAQPDVCSVCGRQCEGLNVDHDHVTGKLRGLLCGNCNRGVGLLGDCALLRRAADYLEASA